MPHPQYLGVDIPIFSIDPNWADEVTLRTLYDTIVLEALDTSEERQTRRPRCLYGFQFNTLGLDGRQTGYLRRILELAKAMPMGMPVWTEATKTTAPVIVGATVLPVDNVDLTLFKNVLTDYALIWTAFNNWEVLKIDSVDSEQITLSDPVSIAVDAGTFVLPLLFGKLPRSATKQITDEHGVFAVDFEERFNGLSDQSHVENEVEPVEMVIEYPTACREEFILRFPMVNETMCVVEISDNSHGPWEDHIFCSMTPPEFEATGGIKQVRINNDYENQFWFRARYAEHPITTPVHPLASVIAAPVVKIMGVGQAQNGNSSVASRFGKLAFSSEEDPYISDTDLYIWPRARKEYRFSKWHYEMQDGDGFDYSTASPFQTVLINPDGASYVQSVEVFNGGHGYKAGEVLKIDDGVGASNVAAEVRIDSVDTSGTILTVTLVESGVYSGLPLNPADGVSEDGFFPGDETGAKFTLGWATYTFDNTLTHKWTRDRNDPTINTVVRPLDGHENNAAVRLDDFGYVIKARSFSDTCKSPQTSVMIDKRFNELPTLNAAGVAGGASNACDFAGGIGGSDSGFTCKAYDLFVPPQDIRGFRFFQRDYVRGSALGLAGPVSGFSLDPASHFKYIFWVFLDISSTTIDYLGFVNHYARANFFAATNPSWTRTPVLWNPLPAGYCFTFLFCDGIDPGLSQGITGYGDGHNYGDVNIVVGEGGDALAVSLGTTSLITDAVAGPSGPYPALLATSSDDAWFVPPMIVRNFEVCASAYDDRYPQGWMFAKPYFFDPGGATDVPAIAFATTPTPVVTLPPPTTGFIAGYAGDDFESYADQDATGATLAGGNHWGGDWVIEAFLGVEGVEDWETYAVATLTGTEVLSSGEAWSGAWVISSPSPIFNDDFESYTVGAIARFAVLNGGTGYSAEWVFQGIAVGLDDFESYTVGAIPTTMNGGTGFTLDGWRVV